MVLSLHFSHDHGLHQTGLTFCPAINKCHRKMLIRISLQRSVFFGGGGVEEGSLTLTLREKLSF